MRDGLVAVAQEAVAIGSLRAGENEVQAVGAALQIFERETIRRIRIREVDARKDGPSAIRFAQRPGAGRLRRRIEGSKFNSVVGL